MKKLIILILASAAFFSVAQEAKAGLNIGISFGEPVRSYRSYYNDGCYPSYYRSSRVVYSAPVQYYVPRREVYYSRPVYYRPSRHHSRHYRNYYR